MLVLTEHTPSLFNGFSKESCVLRRVRLFKATAQDHCGNTASPETLGMNLTIHANVSLGQVGPYG